MVQEILSFTVGKLPILKTHNPISNQNTLELDSRSPSIGVEFINLHSQIRDVLAGVGLSSNPEAVREILWIFFEEIEKSIFVILTGVMILILIILIQVVRISYSSRRLEKQQI